MTDIMTTDEIFFGRTELDKTRLETIITDALHNADDGELYMEYNQSSLNHHLKVVVKIQGN